MVCQLPDPVHHFLHHEEMTDLGLGLTSICQEPWVKHAPLGFTLVGQHIEHGIIAKLQLHDVGEAARE